jgi:transposase
MQLSKDSLVQVRVSSEDAGGISLSPVQHREVPVTELVTWIVRVTGKDAPRIEEILKRGSLVVGLSRMRWESADAAECLSAILDILPDDCPTRLLDERKIREIVVSAGTRQITIPGNAARARRWFRSESFLERWLSSAELPKPAYERYDYGEQADRFRAPIGATATAAYRDAVNLLPSGVLRNALRVHAPTAITMLMPR